MLILNYFVNTTGTTKKHVYLFSTISENKMSPDQIDEVFEFMKDTARKCGEVIKSAFDQPKTVETKDGPVDLVTQTDKKVEKIIIESVKNNYPGHLFIGEESSAAGEKISFTDAPTWVNFCS